MLATLLQSAVDKVPNIFDPAVLINYGGFWLLIFIVFAETGLFIGFFLPGDALLFVAGMLCRSGELDYPVGILLLALNIAAVTGNMVGYAFGKKAGEKLFTRDDSLIFKKRYVQMSKVFYDRYGGIALILGRFLPIVRTFAPIIAGVAKIGYRQFMIYNIIGSVLWTVFMTGSGYYLVKLFPKLSDHIGLVTIGFIILAMGTVLRTYFRQRRRMDKGLNSN